MKLVYALALLPSLAFGAPPPCAPTEEWGNVIDFNVSDRTYDLYVVWTCSATKRTYCMVDSWDNVDPRKLGDRATSIIFSSDPKAAWAASYNRHVKVQGDQRCVTIMGNLK